jgi:hypothetical protein
MSKYVKNLLQGDLENKFEGTTEFVIVNTVGIDGNENNELRGSLREKNIQLTVVKNSMMIRALKSQGIEGVDEIFDGSCTVAYGGDSVVDIAKELRIPMNEALTPPEVISVLNRLQAKNKDISAEWLIGQGKAIRNASVTYMADDTFDIINKLRDMNPSKNVSISDAIYNFGDVLKSKAPVEVAQDNPEIARQKKVVNDKYDARRKQKLGGIQTLRR